MTKLDKGPGVKVPPPLICVFLIGVGYLLNYFIPVSFLWPEPAFYIGIFLIGIAALLACISIYQFWQAKTHIEPWKPASSLMSAGVFAYSRNPIYLSFFLLTLGIGLVLKNIWIVSSSGVLLIVLYILVIKKEEEYLEGVFGELYVDYKNRVRRWL